jgi:hypothetical protein
VVGVVTLGRRVLRAGRVLLGVDVAAMLILSDRHPSDYRWLGGATVASTCAVSAQRRVTEQTMFCSFQH